MEKIQLGKSSLYASKLGLGCINYGTMTKEKDAFSLMDCYVEEGGNLLDTANNYAVWNGGDGRESERCIGKWIHNNSGIRNDILVATKLGALTKSHEEGFSDMQGTSRKTILEEVHKSLEALQTDYIDLLYLHVDDRKTSQEETMETLAEVVKKGYVREIGCSNFRTWRIESARQICKKNGYPFFCAVQQRYSYLQPVMDADFGVQISGDKELESYIEYYKDLTLVSHTSLLYGAYTSGSITDPLYDTKQNWERLEKLKTQGKEIVPWVLKHSTEQFGGSIALFTSSNREHLKQNIEYFNK